MSRSSHGRATSRQLSTERKLEAYYIKNGSAKTVDCGFRLGFLTLASASGIHLIARSRKDHNEITLRVGHPIDLDIIDPASITIIPTGEGVGTFTLSNTVLGKVSFQDYVIPSFPLLLDCDADRDGKVGLDEPGKTGWQWGPNGRGAILLVDNDRDPGRFPGRRSELAPLEVRSTGLSDLPFGLQLRIYATRRAISRFSVYRFSNPGCRSRILGGSPRSVNLSEPLNPLGETLYVAAHEYPHDEFDGLITIELHLRQLREGVPEGVLLQSDRVVFRVAPWLMIPCTARFERVFACDLAQAGAPISDFERFLEDLGKACGERNLTVIRKENLLALDKKTDLQDPWIQDQMEIGYSQGVDHFLHVVANSPRQGQLEEFPESLRGPDVGYFEFEGKQDKNSLDSFGNLEVSPPVEVDGEQYPFGRIIFGGREYGDFSPHTRQMMPRIRRFLYAQKIQGPIEIYTDWLQVGHVDETLSFVPCREGKNFKVLLAWPMAVKSLLTRLSNEGYGQTVLFENKFDRDDKTLELTVPMQISVDELLARNDLWAANDVFQEYMNLNRAILRKRLGLSDGDFIEIPVLFRGDYVRHRLQRTRAYFPNMVNQLVLDNKSIVPKPFGPNVDGKCALEREFEQKLHRAARDQTVTFIDCWNSHHVWSGEVHCATNVVRTPASLPWWHVKPDGAFDLYQDPSPGNFR